MDDNIVVTHGKESALKRLIQDEVNVRSIMDFTRVPVKRRCDQSQLEDYPDQDLFVLVRPTEDGDLWKLLTIISCKVSFHARHTESTFWGLLLRISTNIPFVVVTEDRDIYGPKRSELGASCERSTKTRRLLEAFSDRIYIVNRYDNIDDPKLIQDIERKASLINQGSDAIIFDDPSRPKHTQYCHSVRPIDDMFNDLRRWKTDLPK